jgi:hypothetical protein
MLFDFLKSVITTWWTQTSDVGATLAPLNTGLCNDNSINLIKLSTFVKVITCRMQNNMAAVDH